MLEPIIPDPAPFAHVRVIVGVVTGLAIARVLNGLARFVQDSGRERVYAVHIGWALYLLLVSIHFWWFEFALTRVTHWTFGAYAFLILYAALHFFIAAILFPDQPQGKKDFEQYFHNRRSWFFSLLVVLSVVDMIDTAMKGLEYFQSLGIQYPMRQGAMILLALIAIPVGSRRYHIAFLGFAIASQVWWIASRYDFLAQ
jgi:hypothetical protein